MRTCRQLQNCRGIGLAEILIVLSVMCVVAGLTIPVYIARTERHRSEEAIQHLAAVKDALLQYRSLNGTYAGASFNNIRYDPNVGEAGQDALFSYNLDILTTNEYTVTAQRLPLDANNGNTISLDQAGTLTRRGVYDG